MVNDQQRAWNTDVVKRAQDPWVKAKLTPRQRDEVRQRLVDGETVLDLAAEYGLSARYIRDHFS